MISYLMPREAPSEGKRLLLTAKASAAERILNAEYQAATIGFFLTRYGKKASTVPQG